MKRAALALAAVLTGAALFAQSVELDKGIQQTAAAVTKKLAPKAKVAVLDITADSKEMSSYLSDGLMAALVEDGRFTVVDRSNLESIRGELNFQMGGEVNEESAQSMGAMLGAEAVIIGSFKDDGGVYRLRVKALKVETAELVGMATAAIKPTKQTYALLGTVPPAKQTMGKVGVAALNPLLGLGSFIQGDIKGGLIVVGLEAATIAAGALLGSTGAGEAIGYVGLGASFIYAVARPFIYKPAPKKAAYAPSFDLALLPNEAVNLSFTVPLR